MQKVENEEQADLLDDLIKKNQPITINQIDEIIVDFVLKCIRGVFQGKFLFLNLTPEGETFGSDPEADLSLYVENAGFSKKHAEIKYEYADKRYILKDLGSETGIWIKNRSENPMIIKDKYVFRIGTEKFLVSFKNEQNFDLIYEWLSRINLKKLDVYFNEKKIKNLKEIQDLSEEELKKLDINEIERQNLMIAISEISIDFREDFLKDKLLLQDFKTGETLLEISWSGALIGTLENADYVINMKTFHNENDDDEEVIEVAIKYQNGNYWLVTSKQNTAEVYGKLSQSDIYLLQPDDIINIGELDFEVERFNTGVFSDKGTRPYHEDIVVIRQQLGVSSRLNVSFFAVFDGHGGQDCVKYISDYLIENLRNNFLLGETFDNQEDFYSYIKEVVYQTFKETDKAFFEEYKDLANKTGSAASILLIIGDYLICINLGDSRAVLSRKGKAVALSVDQKPSSSQESQRITKSGGNVINGRVAGNLGVSRAFGDFEFKPITRGEKEKNQQNHNWTDDIVISIPEIRISKIDYLKDEFILMASDGLFDAYSNQKCIDFIRERLVAMPLMEQDPELIAKELVLSAVDYQTKKAKGSDNVSAIIICLTRGVEKIE